MSTLAYQKALTSLRDYLLETLPAKLVTINAERVAVLPVTATGPWTIPANAEIYLKAQNAAAFTTVPLTAGASRNASNVITDITAANVPNLTATKGMGQTVIIKSSVAPAGLTPTHVASGASETNAIFGWAPGGADVVRRALNPPTDETFTDHEASLVRIGFDGGSAMWELIDVSCAPNARGPNSLETDVTVSVRLTVVADSENNVRERLTGFGRAAQECIYADRHLGDPASIVFSEIRRFQPSPRIYQFANQAAAVPVGVATIDVLMRVYG